MLRWVLALAAIGIAGASHAQNPAEDARVEFEQRRARLLSDDLDGRMSLGRWAVENDLPRDAMALHRQWLMRHPDDDRVHAELVAIAAGVPLPVESPALTRARGLLPRHFTRHETRRFVVLSDAGRNFTRSQIERFERAHHQFMRFVKRHDLRPLPLRHKLVCVLFENRDDFRQFARAHDDVRDPSIAGYYSPINERIVFYNPKSNPSVGAANVKLGEMAARIDRVDTAASRAERLGQRDTASALRHTLATYRAHFDRQRDKVDQFIESVCIATTVHEAIHQLMFHTGIQRAKTEYPLWISEGLATAFETDRPNHAFGPDHEYAPRREKFESLLRNDQLLNLESLVQFRQLTGGFDPETTTALYHQSYALITWMARFRRAELRGYLLAMQLQEPGRPDAERHLEIFQASFGDVKQLERSWLRHELSELADAGDIPWSRRLASDGRELNLTPAEGAFAAGDAPALAGVQTDSE